MHTTLSCPPLSSRRRHAPPPLITRTTLPATAATSETAAGATAASFPGTSVLGAGGAGSKCGGGAVTDIHYFPIKGLPHVALQSVELQEGGGCGRGEKEGREGRGE